MLLKGCLIEGRTLAEECVGKQVRGVSRQTGWLAGPFRGRELPWRLLSKSVSCASVQMGKSNVASPSR